MRLTSLSWQVRNAQILIRIAKGLFVFWLLGAWGGMGPLLAADISTTGLSTLAAGIQPVWKSLEDMDAVERADVLIGLENLESGNTALQKQLDAVAQAWNSGDTDAAIASLKRLDFQAIRPALAISSKSPHFREGGDRGIIGTRTDCLNPHLVVHSATAGIFLVLQDIETSSYHWRVYFSIDGGRSWAETFSWNATIPIVDVGAAVVDGYLYITYVTESTASSARVRRCLVSTGAGDSSYGTSGWMEVFDDSGANVVDLEMSSNQEGNDNRLYLFAIMTDGKLTLDFADEEGGNNEDDWTRLDTGVTDAVNCLDVAFNNNGIPGEAGGYLFAVYRNMANKIFVFRFKNPFPEKDTTEIAPYYADHPSISAYRRRLMVVYTADFSPFYGSAVAYSENAGDIWRARILDGGFEGNIHEPVTEIGGGNGLAAVFQRQASSDDLPMISCGNYTDQTLLLPVAASETGLTLGTRMDLAALPDGGLGLVSIHAGGVPFFDRTPMLFLNGFEIGDAEDWSPN